MKKVINSKTGAVIHEFYFPDLESTDGLRQIALTQHIGAWVGGWKQGGYHLRLTRNDLYKLSAFVYPHAKEVEEFRTKWIAKLAELKAQNIATTPSNPDLRSFLAEWIEKFPDIFFWILCTKLNKAGSKFFREHPGARLFRAQLNNG